MVNKATVAVPKTDSWTAAQNFCSHPRTWVHLAGRGPKCSQACSAQPYPTPFDYVPPEGGQQFPGKGGRPQPHGGEGDHLQPLGELVEGEGCGRKGV